ncbi:(2Fe-2S)-binding protein [Streptomyces tubbatahanensis]|uniref:(2Fe-2S)-binding protein n=1 Tax=Streptomyces tubbatahanensis TaxID=2923272 RepID=A0ABY3XQI3_9ACTN|nr:(2Fe-2S)-binding protein [Streptomyces tubbatahanensis]UNS96655.1 (2Fe-2S)-binding protein [Streptomyces tubbatahanensis]
MSAPYEPVLVDELTALSALTDLASTYGPRYHMLPGEPTGPEARSETWLPADRLLAPYADGGARGCGGGGARGRADGGARGCGAGVGGGGELSRLLGAEWRGSGHRTAHAAALTLVAVYAGRVTAAAMLGWVLHGGVWDVRPHNVLVRPGSHGITGVRLREPRLLAAPARERAATLPALHEAVLNTHLLPLARALHGATRAGLRQLYGGVAHGCATALSAAAPRPSAELAALWAKFVRPLPGLARLGDLAEVTHRDGSRRLHYLRNTCCLYYTSAEAVRCASCCLTPRAERLRAYAAR